MYNSNDFSISLVMPSFYRTLTVESMDEQESSLLSKLPPEIILKILTFCSPPTLRVLKLTCKKNYQATTEENLWKRIFSKNFHVSTVKQEGLSPITEYQCSLHELWMQQPYLKKVFSHQSLDYITFLTPCLCLLKTNNNILRTIDLKTLQLNDLFEGHPVLKYEIRANKIYAQLEGNLAAVWPDNQWIKLTTQKNYISRSPEQPSHTLPPPSNIIQATDKFKEFLPIEPYLNPCIFYISDDDEVFLLGCSQGEVKGWSSSEGRLIINFKDSESRAVNFLSFVSHHVIIGFKQNRAESSYCVINLKTNERVKIQDCSFFYLHAHDIIYMENTKHYLVKYNLLLQQKQYFSLPSYRLISSSVYHQTLLFLFENHSLYSFDLIHNTSKCLTTFEARYSESELKRLGGVLPTRDNEIELQGPFVLRRKHSKLSIYDITDQSTITLEVKGEIKSLLFHETLLLASENQLITLNPSQELSSYTEKDTGPLISAYSTQYGALISYTSGLLLFFDPQSSKIGVLRESTQNKSLVYTYLYDYTLVNIWDNGQSDTIEITLQHLNTTEDLNFDVNIASLNPQSSSGEIEIDDDYNHYADDEDYEVYFSKPSRPSEYSKLCALFDTLLIVILHKKFVVYNLEEKKIVLETSIEEAFYDEISRISESLIAIKQRGITKYIYDRNTLSLIQEQISEIETFDIFENRFLVCRHKKGTRKIYDTETKNQFEISVSDSAEIYPYLKNQAVVFQNNSPIHIYDLSTSNKTIFQDEYRFLVGWKVQNEKEAFLVFQDGRSIVLDLFSGALKEFNLETETPISQAKIVANTHQILIAYNSDSFIKIKLFDAENFAIKADWKVNSMKTFSFHLIDFNHFFMLGGTQEFTYDDEDIFKYVVMNFSNNFNHLLQLSSPLKTIVWQNTNHLFFSTADELIYFNSNFKKQRSLWKNNGRKFISVNQTYSKNSEIFFEITYTYNDYGLKKSSAWYCFNLDSLKWEQKSSYDVHCLEEENTLHYEGYKVVWKKKTIYLENLTNKDDRLTHSFNSEILEVKFLESKIFILLEKELYYFHLTNKILNSLENYDHIKICGKFLLIQNSRGLTIYNLSSQEVQDTEYLSSDEPEETEGYNSDDF